jgi:hypothetical protein
MGIRVEDDPIDIQGPVGSEEEMEMLRVSAAVIDSVCVRTGR